MSEKVLVVCSECGARTELSGRGNAIRIREGRVPVCRSCRFPRAVVVTDALVEWWRDEGFTPETALPLAEAVFGPREAWTETLEIPLSGDRIEPGLSAIVGG